MNTQKLTEAENLAQKLGGVNGNELNNMINHIQDEDDVKDAIGLAEKRASYLMKAGLCAAKYLAVARKLRQA